MRDQAIDGFQPTVGKIKISSFINFQLFIYLFFTFPTLPLWTWTCRSLTDTGAGEPIESCRLHGYICGIPTYRLVGRFHSVVPLGKYIHNTRCRPPACYIRGEVMRHLSEESELVRDSVARCGETRFPYTA
ncbi:hypothetical protein BDV41DRAFT_74804 [Aspergillus transmontanensis]|uniref:Uncharacterized protein n=1 Tax=Aspergillus transmontanensis TaxID=1034304 RepID=A0A5N6W8J1_9EURO|nr:hypothetical protein BDV41DRAFT_74804 [Aspergillus transmontanensis]